MASWGNCDFRQLQRLQEKLDRLQGAETIAFCEACAKELSARLLAKVIRRTPVGQYEAGNGKTGGTLRRGWTAKSHHEAQSGGSKNAKAYVNSLVITQSGDTYQIEITNPVEYAPYIEFGHRTRNHKGWVPGRFMLTISEKELESQAPKILERKLMQYLGEIFND
ncbi:HK97 gp10 family phage protein [Cellulosilyticum sp. WCF-2]|uniref:HK97 gp10 family phage protein n=1 Tax=Cellulosilyticum sp. WCF-2 TaxID=2497860 RepID=UPI000F8D9692|nr:HK97 gp10 family phage protein [Cellulosilyticum sp. WCF-2]QEH69919.1 HK97 gp10 family phage protein [Cellulosilyticum sp. WCF-2]